MFISLLPPITMDEFNCMEMIGDDKFLYMLLCGQAEIIFELALEQFVDV